MITIAGAPIVDADEIVATGIGIGAQRAIEQHDGNARLVERAGRSADSLVLARDVISSGAKNTPADPPIDVLPAQLPRRAPPSMLPRRLRLPR